MNIWDKIDKMKLKNEIEKMKSLNQPHYISGIFQKSQVVVKKSEIVLLLI